MFEDRTLTHKHIPVIELGQNSSICQHLLHVIYLLFQEIPDDQITVAWPLRVVQKQYYYQKRIAPNLVMAALGPYCYLGTATGMDDGMSFQYC
jgi:hypothetical protein